MAASMIRWSALLLFVATGLGRVGAQPREGRPAHVEVLNADKWAFDARLADGAQRLVGNVRLKHADATMACDSAYLYADQRVTAFGNVILTQGDTLRITGHRLEYAGSERTARMTGDVLLSDPGITLATDVLTYDARAQRADYTTGARITSSRDASVLTSRMGSYHAPDRTFSFTGNVHLEHPERTIDADTLQFNAGTSVAYFRGPTVIHQEGTRMYCERGSYDTRRGNGLFTKAGKIFSGAQTLSGDSLRYTRATEEGRAWGNVVIADTVNHMLVKGDEGLHTQRSGNSMVTGRAEMVMAMDGDSLYMHADSLFGARDSALGHTVTARRNVRFYKIDLQGVCDTLTYFQTDSLIMLRGDPFLWSRNDQLSGDTLRIKLRDGKADALFVDGNAFLVSQVDSSHFNQITGTTMEGRFNKGELHRLVAEGNCRTVYFTTEKKDTVEQVTGVNRADCSMITVVLDSGKVQTVSFLTQPAAVLLPLEKATLQEMRLDGFRWNGPAKPVDRDDIFRVAPLAPPPERHGR